MMNWQPSFLIFSRQGDAEWAKWCRNAPFFDSITKDFTG
jgi:hypothetical protein